MPVVQVGPSPVTLAGFPYLCVARMRRRRRFARCIFTNARTAIRSLDLLAIVDLRFSPPFLLHMRIPLRDLMATAVGFPWACGLRRRTALGPRDWGPRSRSRRRCVHLRGLPRPGCGQPGSGAAAVRDHQPVRGMKSLQFGLWPGHQRYPPGDPNHRRVLFLARRFKRGARLAARSTA
jgi:hypothetical protein